MNQSINQEKRIINIIIGVGVDRKFGERGSFTSGQDSQWMTRFKRRPERLGQGGKF